MQREDFKVYYDRRGRRLVYLGHAADEEYWDDQWEKYRSWMKTPDRFVLRTTKKYLPRGSKVIDAGCGLARTVYGLHRAGFDAYGIDYAPKTVALVKQLMPELNVSVADVRSLAQFDNGHFDGYWSLGVVEHFYDGYEPIVAEMRRVIRPGGFAFVTVPSMSPLRRARARLGMYPPFNESSILDFYQFALPPDSVINSFEASGFQLVATKPRGGYVGLMNDSNLLRPIMRPFYECRASVLRALRVGLDMILSPLSCHTRLYVFRRP